MSLHFTPFPTEIDKGSAHVNPSQISGEMSLVLKYSLGIFLSLG